MPSSTGLDELLGDRAAHDLVLEHVARARLAGMQVNLRVAVLPAAARLPHVPTLAIRRARERLFVRDLRLAHRRLDVELALQPVDDDLEVKLAHPADDRLAGLRIGVDAESGVLGHQLLQAGAELLLVGFRPWLNRKRDDRIGEVHRLEDDRVLFVAERLSGRDAAEPDGRRDVAGVHLLDLFALVRVHLEQPPDALGSLLGRVVDTGARTEDTRVDTEERQLTDEGVGHDLERQGRERRIV